MKKKWVVTLFVLLAVVCASILIWRPDLMINPKYKMAVTVTLTDENDPEFPVGTKYFDASEWLKQSQYIKVSDYYLIKTDFEPIHDPTGIDLTFELHHNVFPKNQYGYPELNTLKNMDFQEFWPLFKDKIIWEYIYSRFDQDALKPDVDYFLIRFPYKEQWYEVLLRRKPYKDSYSYMAMSVLYKQGGWYKQNDFMTYKQYMEKKAKEENTNR